MIVSSLASLWPKPGRLERIILLLESPFPSSRSSSETVCTTTGFTREQCADLTLGALFFAYGSHVSAALGVSNLSFSV